MFSYTRAAAFAAAVIALAVGGPMAVPGQASLAESTPLETNYRDHASASVDASQIAPLPAGLTAAKPAFAPPPVVTPLNSAPLPEPKPEARAEDKLVRGRPLKKLVAEHAATATDDAQHDCLAGAVYFESKGEPLAGQLAVAETVINRAKSGRFPASYCGVVKQRNQFSFVRGGRIPSIPRSSQAWKTAVAIATIAHRDLADSPGKRALFFHANYVRPSWRGVTRLATVGNHIFYR